MPASPPRSCAETAVATLRLAAVDLGATSGRVMLAEIGPDRLDLHEVHRFPNGPLGVGDGLFWDFPALQQGVLTGLERAAAEGRPICLRRPSRRQRQPQVGLERRRRFFAQPEIVADGQAKLRPDGGNGERARTDQRRDELSKRPVGEARRLVGVGKIRWTESVRDE